MLSRILLVCLSLSVNSAASSLSCRWITDEKFRQHSENYLQLLDTMVSLCLLSLDDVHWMTLLYCVFPSTHDVCVCVCVCVCVLQANNSTNSTEDDEVKNTFPEHLYSQASKASAEDKLAFTAQVLNETSVLFEEDHSSASWEENTVENFVIVVTQQADELRSCIGSHGHKKKNKKLHMYFQRLSSHVLQRMGHSAEAWELIRKEVQFHLMRANQLVTSATRTN
ncbi:interferon a3-like isoform X1 [Acanthopagrus latus]|uniref:interferon a3-like isoform X1 n=1 Tax=Acanthopagrus latus TaxID=8177 RepID=UPI00187BE9A6|nr:interferon a3-like isoform X1 [Acanthopagrus latus]